MYKSSLALAVALGFSPNKQALPVSLKTASCRSARAPCITTTTTVKLTELFAGSA